MTTNSIPNAEAGSPNSPDISRRDLWMPLALGMVAGAVAGGLAPCSAAHDPIFALIEEHAVALKYTNNFDGPDAELNDLCEVERQLLDRVLATKPKTLKGLAAFVDHVNAYPDFAYLGEEPAQALATIADAIRDILKA